MLSAIKQVFDAMFPSWPARWAAYGVLALACGLGLGAILASACGCDTVAGQTAQATAPAVIGGGVGAAAAGPVGGAIGAGVGAAWGAADELSEAAKDLDHEQERQQGPPAPWQVTFGFWTLVVLIAGAIAALIAANYIDWLPSLLRRRSS